MRVWDISVHQLCNKHLVAQHHEIHCIYSIITNGLKGFAHHPEVMRWRGRQITALSEVHDDTVTEMIIRGYHHYSPLPLFSRLSIRPEPWQPVEEQIRILKAKGCGCNV